MSAPKLFLVTYGCQMNEYDSAKMAGVLERSHGYARTENPDEADLLLLNTCSVREKAQEKVFSELGRWKEWKSSKPGRVIGVGGCVASQEGEQTASLSGSTTYSTSWICSGSRRWISSNGSGWVTGPNSFSLSAIDFPEPTNSNSERARDASAKVKMNL